MIGLTANESAIEMPCELAAWMAYLGFEVKMWSELFVDRLVSNIAVL